MPTIEGRLIRKWRESQGLRQEDIGDPVGLGKNRISNIEKGANSLSVANLTKLLVPLGVPGATDALRLARFFLGPEAAAIDHAIEAARDLEDEARKARRTLEPLATRRRRR